MRLGKRQEWVWVKEIKTSNNPATGRTKTQGHYMQRETSEAELNWVWVWGGSRNSVDVFDSWNCSVIFLEPQALNLFQLLKSKCFDK